MAQAAENVNISSGLVMGTVKYMSPEQTRGQSVDPRSDIFSFGVVLYEMLAGRTPFEGESSSELIAAILKKEPPPLTSVPDEMKRLVNRALRKKKEERYQTIQELLGDLKSLKEDKAASGGGEQIVPATTAASGLSTSEAAAVSTGSTVEYVVSGIKRHKTTAAFILASLALVGVSLPFSLNRLSSKLSAPSKEMTTTVTVPGNAGPWLVSLNPAFPYTLNNDYAAPGVVSSASGIPFVVGSKITVTYVSSTFTGDGGGTYLDANGSTPTGANQLLLGINDNRYGDNSGFFTVAVSSVSATPKRVARPSQAPNKASGC